MYVSTLMGDCLVLASISECKHEPCVSLRELIVLLQLLDVLLGSPLVIYILFKGLCCHFATFEVDTKPAKTFKLLDLVLVRNVCSLVV